MKKPKSLTAKQTAALPMLATGATAVEVARTLHIAQSTISAWLHHDVVFQRQLDQLRETTLTEAIEEFRSTVLIAVREVRRLLAQSESDAVRLRACELVLERAGFSDLLQRETAEAGETGSVNLNMVLIGLGIRHD